MYFAIFSRFNTNYGVYKQLSTAVLQYRQF